MNLAFGLALAVILSGCVPWPYVETGSSAMRGRVIDSVTKLPVQNATVSLHERRSIRARTNREGLYRIRAAHYVNILLAGGICGTEIPLGKDYGDELDVHHPLYQPMHIQADKYRDPLSVKNKPLELIDIALVPIPKDPAR